MRIIIGGIKILFVAFYIATFVCYPGINYAEESSRQISMDFQEASLKDVLKIFSQQAGLNFVAAREIEDKKVTLYLDGVSVQDALDSIINANNLAYEQKPGSSVFIVKPSTASRVKLVTKVYGLNYARVAPPSSSTTTEGTATSGEGTAQAGDIKSIIENLLSKDEGGKLFGSVIIDPRTNSLIITSVPEDFPLIEATLAKLDAQTLQVMIEAEIIEVQTTAIKKLGLDWGGTSTGTFFTFSGPSRDTGFPFVRETGILSRSLLGGSIADSRGRTIAASSTGTVFGNLTLSEFRIVLKALEKENKARYLAKPKIMVINNQTAEIKIAEDTAVGTTTTSQATTGTTSTTAERVETGVILTVTPTINKDDYITMELRPEVSRVQTSNVSGYFDPTKRSARTTVMVKNGQTLAMGGLLKADTTDNDRAVPGLSKIPLFGKIFKSKDYQNISTEIIIFVTCYIVKPEMEKQQKTAEFAPAAAGEVNQPSEAVATERDNEIANTVTRLRKRREIE